VTTTELQFKLTDRLSEPVTIDWEKAAYVDLWGTKHRVIHQGVRLTEKDKPQAPTHLAAGDCIDEMVYPSDLVAGSRAFEDWRLNPLLPLSQDARGLLLAHLRVAVAGNHCQFDQAISIHHPN